MKKPFKTVKEIPCGEPGFHWVKYTLPFKRLVFIKADQDNNWHSFGASPQSQVSNVTDATGKHFRSLTQIISYLFPEK
jgi:hypothetical protein